jgi:FixJ family two-component response regulator
VFVVDDDRSIRESLEFLIRSVAWRVRTFRCVRAFLGSPPILVPSCLVLGVARPELDGPDLQERVAVDRPGMPIILMA